MLLAPEPLTRKAEMGTGSWNTWLFRVREKMASGNTASGGQVLVCSLRCLEMTSKERTKSWKRWQGRLCGERNTLRIRMSGTGIQSTVGGRCGGRGGADGHIVPAVRRQKERNIDTQLVSFFSHFLFSLSRT